MNHKERMAKQDKGLKHGEELLARGKNLLAEGRRVLEQDKTYPETRYFAHRISQCGHQPVYKQLLPDGEPELLPILPSQKLNDIAPSFQWGYFGQGPAQLALALLLDATTNPDVALAYYQQFKCDIVASWGDEWTIFSGEISEWLKEQERRELGVRISKN